MKGKTGFGASVVRGLALSALLCSAICLSAFAQDQGKPSGSNLVLKEPAGLTLSRLEKDELQILGLQLELKSLQAMVSDLQNQLLVNQSALQTLQARFANHTHDVTIQHPGNNCYAVDNFNLTTGAGRQENVALGYIVKCPNGQSGIPASSEVVKSSPPK